MKQSSRGRVGTPYAEIKINYESSSVRRKALASHPFVLVSRDSGCSQELLLAVMKYT